MPLIVMYTTPNCPFCQMAKRLLAEKGQTWTEIDVAAEPARRAEMTERSGRTTVPQIWVGDRHVGGFDDQAAVPIFDQVDALQAFNLGTVWLVNRLLAKSETLAAREILARSEQPAD